MVGGLPKGAREAIQAFERQALHAGILGFDHPISGNPLKFESKLPHDMLALMAALAA